MSIIRSSISLSLLTGLNIILSFFNQVVIAYLFGTSWEMDAYLVATALPLTIVGITSGGLGFIVIPTLMRHKDNENELRKSINGLFSVVIIAAVLLALFGCVCGGFIIVVTAFQLSAEKFDLATKLAPIVWIMAALNMIGGFLIGLQHLYKRFSIASISLGMPTVGMIVSGLLFAHQMGIRSIVIGGVVGSLLQVLILLVATRCPAWFRLAFNFGHPDIKDVLLCILPLAGSLLPFTIFPVIDVFWASGLPDGSISYLGYSTRIVIVLTTIASHGISVAIFPFLSEKAASGETAGLKEMTIKAIRAIFLLVFPMVVIFTVLKIPLAQVVFERGSFSRSSTAGVVRVLPFYLASMIGMAPMYILIRVFYSLRDFGGAAKLGLAGVALYFLLSGFLAHYFSYLGLGFAYAIHWSIMFLINCAVLSRKLGRFWSKVDFVFLVKIAAGALITGCFVMYIHKFLEAQFNTTLATILSLCAGPIVFSAIHLSFIKIKEMEIIAGTIANMLGMRNGARSGFLASEKKD